VLLTWHLLRLSSLPLPFGTPFPSSDCGRRVVVGVGDVAGMSSPWWYSGSDGGAWMGLYLPWLCDVGGWRRR